jgi:hypothetical protein
VIVPSSTPSSTKNDDEHREVESGSNPAVPCKVCGKPIQRKEYGRATWVHSDDEWVMEGGKMVSEGKYDHPATPDFIDVTFREA